jgi:hypothetical protein
MFRSYKRKRGPTTRAGDEGSLLIRLAGPDDEAALRRLAALDSSRPLAGAVLVAELDGELRAARSLRDGRTVADPFRPTLALRDLLELRARQLAGTAAGVPILRAVRARGETGLPRTA